jgi:hypothetical protein
MAYLSLFDGLFWLALALVALLFLQRALHREIQALLLILSRDAGFTLAMFSLIFLPGVFLHELSHYLMAKLLGLRTGRISLLPKPLPGGRLQMGFVETVGADILRDSLVGAAPILTGSLFVAWVSVSRLHLVVLWDTLRHGQWSLFGMGLQALPSVPDFWIWFYLTFVVSSTMLPSESDRHAWAPLLLVAGGLFGLALLAGAGPWMLENLAAPLNSFLRGTALILLVSILVHIVLILPFWLLHRLAARLTGLDIG